MTAIQEYQRRGARHEIRVNRVSHWSARAGSAPRGGLSIHAIHHHNLQYPRTRCERRYGAWQNAKVTRKSYSVTLINTQRCLS